MIKKLICLTSIQTFRLKAEAIKLEINMSELTRRIIDDYFKKKGKK